MYCKKCGNQLNEGDRFCSNCQNPVGQNLEPVSVQNNNMNKAEGWRRVLAVALDGIISSPLFFFLGTLISIFIAILSASSDGGSSSFSFVAILFSILIFINPMFIHSLCMFIFGNTLGNKIMKIQIKNEDGSDFNRGVFGRQFLFSIVFFVPILSLTSVIICIATGQLISDKVLHLQAYKK